MRTGTKKEKEKRKEEEEIKGGLRAVAVPPPLLVVSALGTWSESSVTLRPSLAIPSSLSSFR